VDIDGFENQMNLPLFAPVAKENIIVERIWKPDKKRNSVRFYYFYINLYGENYAKK